MKGLYILLAILCQVSLSRAQDQISGVDHAISQSVTERDYTAFAKESLEDFYTLVTECLLDPENQSLFVQTYKENLYAQARFVADFVDPFPKDELYSFESYLSNVKMGYPNVLHDRKSKFRIVPDDLKIEEVISQGKGVDVRVNYQICVFQDTKVLFMGDSEAVLYFPNPNYRYSYKFKSVLPKSYNSYRKFLHTDISTETLAKEAMRNGDYGMARKYFEQLIEIGKTDYLFDLADIYFMGYGIDRDVSKAYELLQALYKTGTPRGWGGMAYLFWNGVNVPKDDIQARYYAEEALNRGDAIGYCIMGDILGSMEYLEKSAKGGYAVAYKAMAEFSYYRKDVDSFNRYVIASLSEGQPHCYTLRGFQYHKGFGVDKDFEKAYYYYSLAINKYGLIPAYEYMGLLFSQNSLMDQAIGWFELGYKNGYQSCGIRLFDIFSDYDTIGKHVAITDSIRQCRRKALSYLPKDLNYKLEGTRAYRAMRICLSELNIPDFIRAFSFAQQAIGNGVSEANYELAEMYFEGKGTDKDLIHAKTHYLTYLQNEDDPSIVKQPSSRKRMSRVFDLSRDVRKERYWHSLQQIGLISLLQKDYVQAVEVYEKALRIKPSQDIYNQLYTIFNNASDKVHYNPKKAQEMHLNALELDNKEL